MPWLHVKLSFPKNIYSAIQTWIVLPKHSGGASGEGLELIGNSGGGFAGAAVLGLLEYESLLK